MAEGITFPMRREFESASRLRQIISDMLPLFSEQHSDDDILSYIAVVVCSGMSQRQARNYLEAFLGDQSREFVACSWELLLKDTALDKRETSGSEPRTGVDFGSHNTLIKQGSSSQSCWLCSQSCYSYLSDEGGKADIIYSSRRRSLTKS